MSEPASIPGEDQVWEVIDGCEAEVQYLFSAPITFSGPGRLAAGERVRVLTEGASGQAGVVSFVPVRYDELHDRLVPREMRETPRYKRYRLTVSAGYFREQFRRVSGVA